jgi:hypothetical protein
MEAHMATIVLILSMLGPLVLIASLLLVTIIRFFIWLAIRLIIYFLYSQRKSHLQQEEAMVGHRAATLRKAGDCSSRQPLGCPHHGVRNRAFYRAIHSYNLRSVP